MMMSSLCNLQWLQRLHDSLLCYSQAVPYSSEASQGFASASKAGCDFVPWATGSAFLLNKHATLRECEKEVVAEMIKALPFYSRKALLNYTPRKQD